MRLDNKQYLRYHGIMTRSLYFLMIVLILSGCGRTSRLRAPEGATYPETYVVKE